METARLEAPHKGMTFDWNGDVWTIHEDPASGVNPLRPSPCPNAAVCKQPVFPATTCSPAGLTPCQHAVAIFSLRNPGSYTVGGSANTCHHYP